MGVPCTWHGYEDIRLQLAAKKLHLPASAGVVGMQGVKEAFGHDVRPDAVAKHLAAFAAMDEAKTGRLDCAQFAQGLGVPITEELAHLFALLDDDDSGTLDFREVSRRGRGGEAFMASRGWRCLTFASSQYLLGLALLSKSRDPAGMTRLLFRVFDKDDDGVLSAEELGAFLRRVCRDVDVDVDAADALREATGNPGATGASYEDFQRLIAIHPDYMEFFRNKLGLLG